MSSYLGRGIEQVDNISKLDNLTFNGGTTYALTKNSSAFQAISSNAILISVSGVIQQGNFSVSGTNIVFDSAVASSETCDFIMHYGTGVAFTPADNSITDTKLNSNSVTTAKIQNDAVTKDKVDFVTDSGGASLEAKGSSGYDGAIRLNCSVNTHFTELKSSPHGSYSGNLNFVLPSSHGTNGQFLQTNGSGGLSFADAGGGDFVRLSTIDQDLGSSQKIQFTQVFSSDYDFYRLIGRANVGSLQQALIYFRWLNSSNSEQTSAEYHYAGYGRYSSSDDAGGNVAWQAMSETSGLLVTDFYGGSYNRTMFYDMTFYPKVNSSVDRSAFQGQISYNAYNSGNGGWNATSVGGTYNSSTDLSGGGLQIECNTSYDYVTMSLYGVKLA